MRKLFTASFVVLTVSLVSGCGSSPDTSSYVPSPPTAETRNFAEDEENFGFIPEWSTGVSWQPPESGTNDDDIVVDEQHVIDAGNIRTRYITATFTEADFQRVFLEGLSRNEFDTLALERGWQIRASLEADGPTGTQWGYSRVTDQGTSFMIISAQGVDCTADENSPAICLNFASKVSVTSPFTPDGDL